jgi:phosphoribosyl-ATP pyrophosphohydrolase
MVNDSKQLLEYYGFKREDMDIDKLEFRLDLLTEEYKETMLAFGDSDAEEFVDGMIDMMVIILGTLNLVGVDINKAWKEVLRANMSKERGIKPGREQSAGFDLIKPKGWIAPDHSDNHGDLHGIFKS